MALAKPGTVGGVRCRGVYISSFSCLTKTTIRVSGGGTTFLLGSVKLLVFNTDTEPELELLAPWPAPPLAIAGCCKPKYDDYNTLY